jgi:hypothetical protein
MRRIVIVSRASQPINGSCRASDEYLSKLDSPSNGKGLIFMLQIIFSTPLITSGELNELRLFMKLSIRSCDALILGRSIHQFHVRVHGIPCNSLQIRLLTLCLALPILTTVKDLCAKPISIPRIQNSLCNLYNR